jgi:hypothetical protein
VTGPRWTTVGWLFLVAVLVGTWWSWRSSGEELADALRQVSAARVTLAGALVVCGVLMTAAVWQVSLRAFQVVVSPLESIPSFFVAQLGKYIPGSVWSFAAQGALGARQGLPVRVSAAAAVLFLGVHVASGLLFVGILGWWTALPTWVVLPALVTGLAGLAPVVHRNLGRRVGGRACDWTIGRSVRGVLLMAPAWVCYSLGLLALAPDPSAGLGLLLGCAFMVAFSVGVAVPIAPAGIGARDGALLVLITPVMGAGPAAAIVVTGRLIHTCADFLLAGVSWWLMRTLGAPGRANTEYDAD